MRVAAAVIGGAGAALGATTYLLAIVFWVAILALSGYFPTTLVDLALVGSLAAGLLLTGVGTAGVWLSLKARARRGALLMLLSAMGIVAVFAAQPFLVDAAGDRGLPERLQNGWEPTLAGYSGGLFAPAALLLVGATLAFVAPERGAWTYASGRA